MLYYIRMNDALSEWNGQWTRLASTQLNSTVGFGEFHAWWIYICINYERPLTAARICGNCWGKKSIPMPISLNGKYGNFSWNVTINVEYLWISSPAQDKQPNISRVGSFLMNSIWIVQTSIWAENGFLEASN